MVAGEYAALCPSGLAVALAVAPRLAVRVVPAGAARAPSGFVAAALREAVAVFGAPGPLAVEVSATGPPPGMGTSAAVTVATVAAVAAAAGLDLAQPDTRRLVTGAALAAHLAAQGYRGSGYDVLTVSHGGAVVVRGPTEAPLAHLAYHLRSATARERAFVLGGAPKVTAVRWPPDVAVLALSAGAKAATPDLIARAQGADPAPLATAAESVAAALAAEASPATLLAAMRDAQRAFEAWDAHHGLALMTSRLAALAAAVTATPGVVARVSGAGGGDWLLAVGRAADVANASHRFAAAGHRVCAVRRDSVGFARPPQKA